MVTATVVYPIHLRLTPEQESEYRKLADEFERENHLLDLADHYLAQGPVDPILDDLDDSENPEI